VTENSTPPVVEYFVDAGEIAEFLKADRRTVLRKARNGEIPAHPLDPNSKKKDWRFLISEVDAWLRSHVNSACRPCSASRSVQ
jgi:excisionase family DNA binding protein